ncbi:MAG: RNA polymerase sigma factor [Candidatus Omnitrophica bacterium]|nr:RNA polymerase sigma factor [Candidatus Omnitrophota bacterium]
MTQSDEDLMKAYQLGDVMAMQHIFEHNKSRILNFCYRLLGNRADAEDISAEVFLSMVKNKHLYDPQRTFSTWIFTIARNLCFNRLKSRKHTVSMWFSSHEQDSFESWDVADQGIDSRESLARQERAGHVHKALAGLPLEQREVLELRQYQGFSYAQISQIKGCSLEKVKILIFRAKENLRIELSSLIKEEHS